MKKRQNRDEQKREIDRTGGKVKTEEADGAAGWSILFEQRQQPRFLRKSAVAASSRKKREEKKKKNTTVSCFAASLDRP